MTSRLFTTIYWRAYVLVHQASPMKLTESHSDVDRQAQEVVRLRGRAEQPLERPPGASSTSVIRPLSCVSATGHAAQSASSSDLSGHSCSSRSTQPARFLLQQRAGSASSRCQSPGGERCRPPAATRIRSPRARSRKPLGRRITLRC